MKNNIKDLNTQEQNIAMTIIAHSGEGRSKAFDALKNSQNGNFEKSKKLIEESRKEIEKAHDAQTKLLIDEAKGKKIDFSILIVHAQDHFMASILAHDLIHEMIKTNEQIKFLQDEIKK